MVHRLLQQPVYGHRDHSKELINKLKAGLSSGYPEDVAE